MSDVPGALAAVALGYLLGALPFGLLIGRWLRGIDIRDYGSHRTGATNALRTLGAPAALAVFLLDVGKGAGAVVLARLLVSGTSGIDPEWVAAAAGFAAIVGHNWSIFIRFTGGRGVATSLGAMLALLPWVALVVVPVVALILWRWRYVSLGSISGAALVPVVALGLLFAGVGGAHPAHVAYGVAAGALVIAAHGDNIARLRTGTERKIGQKERLNA